MDPSRETPERPADPGPATQAYRPPGTSPGYGDSTRVYRPAAEPSRDQDGARPPLPPRDSSGAAAYPRRDTTGYPARETSATELARRQDTESRQLPSRERDALAARRVTETPPPSPAPGGTERAPVQVRRLRRGRLAIRKIDPWAVLRFSLVFYFCMLLIVLLSTAIIFAVLKVFGVIDNLEKLLRDLEFQVTIAGGTIFRWMFLLGLVGTVIASAITVFMAFLYNLIADVVGGIELLVTERES